jgi:PKD repeat protein
MKTLVLLFSTFGSLFLTAALVPPAPEAVPSADFAVSPANPAVNQEAGFLDTSGGSPNRWTWDFGDGTNSIEHNPTHAYASPGHYVVSLKAGNAGGSNTKVRDVWVSAQDTLLLNEAGGHAFSATIFARNQRNDQTGPGFALPQTDISGYFSLPALTRNPDNPEIFVKIVDGNFLNGHYWVFYGGLTDLEYTLTVRDELTGASKDYLKPAGSAAGGFDTSAFPGQAQAGSTSAWRAVEDIVASAVAGFGTTLSEPLVLPGGNLSANPVNPVLGQPIRFSSDYPPNDSLRWTLDTNVTINEREPVYKYAMPGIHAIGALNLRTHGYESGTITISPLDQLRLLPGNEEFLVGLTARDPRSGRVATGQAFANNALFGAFSIPGFTGNPNNAEVIVKVLDGRGVNGNYWPFYGGLTDVQWTLDVKLSSLSLSKYYFKDSYSALGGYDTSGFHNDKLPVIDSISPTSGTFGTTIRLLGKNFYADLTEPFFDDSTGHLKNVKFPLTDLRVGVDVTTGKDFLEFKPTNPTDFRLTQKLTFPISVAFDHYLATAPLSFDLLPPSGSTTPTPPTPTPTSPTSNHTPTPTPPHPTPTPTVPQTGAPVIYSTTTDDVNDGSVFDIFGMNLGGCNSTTTFEGTPGVFPLMCQFGDDQSIEVKVPTGGVIPVGSYNVCVARMSLKGCTSFQMRKH